MAVIQFQTLWDSHPLNLTPANSHPCDGENSDGTRAFSNQCAIKMSIALTGAGLNLDLCNKAKCWFGHENHVLRAEELADWLAIASVLGTPTKFTKKRDTNTTFQTNVLAGINSKNGIVFCKDFWTRSGQSSPTGDHIDVWNGTHMGGSQSHDDYYGRSSHVWFWEIKV